MKKYEHYIDVRGEVLPTPRDTGKTFSTYSSDFNTLKQNDISVLFLLCFRCVCLLMPCGHLMGKG